MSQKNHAEKVEVYYNSRRKNFSVRSNKTKKVLFRTDRIDLKNPKFVVQEGGRQRVLATNQKNVHALVIGEIDTKSSIRNISKSKTNTVLSVYYNPYVHAKFTVYSVHGDAFPVDESKYTSLFINKLTNKPEITIAS